MITLKIPFQGFYDSVHNSIIDDAENQLFIDHETGADNNDGLQTRFYLACDYKQVFTNYARAYTQSFKDEFNIPSLEFISLNSPREYNFATDSIECSINREDIRAIYKSIDRAVLADFIKLHCTSRSGFSSFYDADVKTWGYVDNWEYAQLSLLLQCYFENHTNYSEYWEYETMAEHESNGYITQWLEDACPIIDRLYRIHDYLMLRASRGN